MLFAIFLRNLGDYSSIYKVWAICFNTKWNWSIWGDQYQHYGNIFFDVYIKGYLFLVILDLGTVAFYHIEKTVNNIQKLIDKPVVISSKAKKYL